MFKFFPMIKFWQGIDGDGAGAGGGGDDAAAKAAAEAAASAAAGKGAAGGSPDWKSTLHPDTQKLIEVKGWKTPEDAIKGYSELEKLVGQDKIPAPRKDKDGKYEKGELERYLKAVGLPNEAKDYKVPTTIKIEDGAGITTAQLEAFQPIAHKYGLLPHQFEGVMADFAAMLNKGVAAKTKADNAKYDESVAGLKSELGDAYDGAVTLANRVMKSFVAKERGDEIVKKFGNDPDLIKLLANIGENLSEDKLSAEGMGGGGMMTPDQAEAEMKAIRADTNHPYFKAQHADHGYWVTRMDQLTRMSLAGKK